MQAYEALFGRRVKHLNVITDLGRRGIRTNFRDAKKIEILSYFVQGNAINVKRNKLLLMFIVTNDIWS